MVGLVAAERAQHDERERAEPKDHQAPPLLRIGEIEPPLVRHRGRMLDRPATLRPGAEENERETDDQEAWRDDIGEDAEIRILVILREIHPHQEREREQRPRRHDRADGADPVVEIRARLRRANRRYG